MLLSPRYPTLFSPEKYARIRRGWYRSNFQYLKAGEKQAAMMTLQLPLEEWPLQTGFAPSPPSKTLLD